MEPDRDGKLERRFKSLLILVSVIFGLLGLRLWYLQIVHGEYYASLAEGNRVRLIRTPAPRGQVYDRNGKLVATNRQAFSVSVLPRSIPKQDYDRVVARLGELLEMPVDEIDAAIRRGRASPYEPVRIKSDIDPATVVRIEECRTELPGVIIEEAPVRRYVYGDAAGPVLGYLGPIGPAELRELSSKGYRATDVIGISGLEKTYEGLLRGTDGVQQVEVNAVSRPIRVLGTQEPVPGNDLILTMDIDLQLASEKALRKRIQEIEEEGKYKQANAGAVVVMEVHTGKVLALVSHPGYDPNLFVGGVSEEYYNSLKKSPSSLFNWATMGQYAPGSAIKPVIAAAALEEGKLGYQEKFYADDIGPFGIKKDWTLNSKPPLPPHGWLDVKGALAESCNDFFWEIGLRLGPDLMADYMRRFGLGQPTGIDMFPADAAGLVPDRKWKERTYKDWPPWDRAWQPGDTLDMAIGQGPLLVTPVQMASLYAAIANRGTLYQPILVERAVSPEGEVVFQQKPVVKNRIEMSSATWQTIADGMKAVVKTGTAAKAFAGFPVSVAGKTGSAQVDGGDPHGWFAAFAPAEDPKIAVVVLIKNGGGGSYAAAPVAREILEAYFGID